MHGYEIADKEADYLYQNPFLVHNRVPNIVEYCLHPEPGNETLSKLQNCQHGWNSCKRKLRELDVPLICSSSTNLPPAIVEFVISHFCAETEFHLSIGNIRYNENTTLAEIAVPLWKDSDNCVCFEDEKHRTLSDLFECSAMDKDRLPLHLVLANNFQNVPTKTKATSLLLRGMNAECAMRNCALYVGAHAV